jgi:hypothetical protein
LKTLDHHDDGLRYVNELLDPINIIYSHY